MKLNFSRSQLRKIGDKLRHGEGLSEDEEAMFSYFRIGHLSIMATTFHFADEFMPNDVLVGARLKRRQTIVAKLANREKQMDVTRMNDIAGCRLVFSSMDQLERCRRQFSEKMGKHFDKRFDDGKYDYIQVPDPETGYRGIHEVFQDRDESSSIRAFIEIQYRTLVQHSWATALEIWDNVTMHGAKFGMDNPEIQRFFLLVSELLWRCFDKRSNDKCKLTLSPRRLFLEIAYLEKQHGILTTLRKITDMKLEFHGPDEKNDFYILRRFIPSTSGEPEKKVVMTSVDPDFLEDFFKKELVEQDTDSMVFMSKDYKQSYPNYLNNAKQFLRYTVKALDSFRNKLGYQLGPFRLFQPKRFYSNLDGL